MAPRDGAREQQSSSEAAHVHVGPTPPSLYCINDPGVLPLAVPSLAGFSEPRRAAVRAGTLRRLRERFGDEAVAVQLDALARHGNAVEDPDLWLETAVAGRFKFMEIERSTVCPCGSSESVALSRFVFWNLLGYRQCRRCSLVFVSPHLTAASLQRLFSEAYFDPGHPEVWGQRREPIFADAAALLARLGSRTVLDVGAAYGHLVHYLARRGIRAVGCDIASFAVEWGRRNLGVDIREGSVADVAPSLSPVDAVICFDALYYSPVPQADLAHMRRVLKSGGHLIIRLRNPGPALARARLEARKLVGRPVIPAEHLFAFSPKTITPLLEAHGFRVLEIQPAAYSRTPLGATLQAATWINRSLRRGFSRIPVLTRSFTVLAQRA